MKLTAKPLAILVFVLMFGGITLGAALNVWNTSSTKIPAKFTSGELTGTYNPADIRGSYKFGEVSSLFEIPLEDLKVAFHIPEGVNPAEAQLKTLETQFADAPQEIGTDAVRYFVAFYKGLPIDLTVDTYQTLEGAGILKAKGKMTADQLAYLEKHTIDVNAGAAVATPAPAGTPAPVTTTPAAEHTSTPGLIVGKTTFQELLDWGVTKEAIELVLGGPMPPASAIIKDYATSKGLEFSTLKTALQAEIDKVKK